jgi:hypothetical protein
MRGPGGSPKCVFWESWRCAPQWRRPVPLLLVAATRQAPTIRQSRTCRTQLDGTRDVCRAATVTMIAHLNFVDSKTRNRILNQPSRIMKADAIELFGFIQKGPVNFDAPLSKRGNHLPGYYELHREEFLMIGIILVASLLLIAVFRYRMYLRSSLTTILGCLLAQGRMTASKVRLFWIEVEDKANRSL